MFTKHVVRFFSRPYLTSAHYQLQLRSDPPNLSLTYVSCRLYYETALLQFMFIDFQCVNIWVCAILLLRFTETQWAALKNLTIEVILGTRYPVQYFLEYPESEGLVFSQLYSSLRRVNIANRPILNSAAEVTNRAKRRYRFYESV
jgi:hypothetical protein